MRVRLGTEQGIRCKHSPRVYEQRIHRERYRSIDRKTARKKGGDTLFHPEYVSPHGT